MKTILYLNIAIRIIGLFSTGFFMSFLTPSMHDFFGDIRLENPESCFTDSYYKWAIPHYWFAWCMFFLFALSVVNFIMWVISSFKKHYPES